MTNKSLRLILLVGEGYTVEFKERVSKLDRELVSMANAGGGSIYIGVSDDGQIVSLSITNRLKSQIQDIARNCESSIPIRLVTHEEGVLEVVVPEGLDKPYSCKEGFFLRTGPSAQKMKRDEIIYFINQVGKTRFDESVDDRFQYSKDFSEEAFKKYLKLCGIHVKAAQQDLLLSLNVAVVQNGDLKLNHAGVLFFAKNPQQFIPESYVTCVKYTSTDRSAILDKKDFFGSPFEQIEGSVDFCLRHMSVAAEFVKDPKESPGVVGKRKDVYDYPVVALREAIINAVTHRDYLYDASHIYIHLFSDRIEIENPGGLYTGLTVEKLGKRSVRRNRLIADLLHRAGYIERVGGGFERMRKALAENNNPPLEVVPTNFFDLHFYLRMPNMPEFDLTPRQLQLYCMIEEKVQVTKKEVAVALGVSGDTALRALKYLLTEGLIKKEGVGKSTVYRKR